MSRSTLALLPALLLACDLIGSPTIDLVVSTEHSSYEASSLQTLVPIRLVLENKGRATLEIGRCGERLAAYVDRRIGPNWKQILQSGLVCQAAFDMSPLRLAPGNTVTTVPILVASGRYRFRVPYSRVGERAHARLATSNEAIVTPAP